MLALTFGCDLSASTAAIAKNGRKVSLAPSRASNAAFALARRRATFVTSTSTTVVSCAPCFSDSTIRWATIVLSRDIFSVVPRSGETSVGVLTTGGSTGRGGVTVDAEAAASAALAAAAEAAASASTVTPPRPVAPPVVRTPTDVSPLRGTTEKMSRLRTIVAQRMVESLKQGAQLTTVVEVDVTKVARLRAKAKAAFETREGAKLTFLPFFAMAAVEALKSHPKVNASIDGDKVVYHGEENLGIAVDTDRGLLVPVIRDAGALNLAGIARKIQDVAARTRANKVGPDELAGATFTITNTGSGGALFDTPIVPLPQVAIMGTGAIVKRPVVVSDADGGETIAIRSMCYLSLSYDHRLVDGADAARYLSAVKARIEEGAFESEVGM